MPTAKLPARVVAALREAKIIGLRADARPHRFIGLWVVTVADRVFVRSWSLKPDGWHRTLRKDPRGTIQAADRELPIHAVFPKSKTLLNSVDRAYREKYSTLAAQRYVRDLCGAKSRATTTELRPASGRRSPRFRERKEDRT